MVRVKWIDDGMVEYYEGEQGEERKVREEHSEGVVALILRNGSLLAAAMEAVAAVSLTLIDSSSAGHPHRRRSRPSLVPCATRDAAIARPRSNSRTVRG